MIDITLKHGYRIYNVDDLNVCLAKVDTVQDPKSKNFGKQTEKRIGYFGDLKAALMKYTDQLTMSEYVEAKGDLRQILSALDEIKSCVIERCKK